MFIYKYIYLAELIKMPCTVPYVTLTIFSNFRYWTLIKKKGVEDKECVRLNLNFNQNFNQRASFITSVTNVSKRPVAVLLYRANFLQNSSISTKIILKL